MNTIVLTGVDSAQITIADSAIERRNALLKEAAEITAVTNSFEMACATDTLKNLNATLKQVEAARKEVKEPVLTIGRQIDDVAKGFIEPLVAQQHRVNRLVTQFELIEREKREKAAREAREAEQSRLRQLHVEQAQAVKRAATEEEAEAAVKELQEKAINDIVETHQQAQAIAAPKIEGLKIRKTLRFEIVDVAALHASRPDLFSPDDTKIRAALKLTTNIAGLRVWEETKTSF